MAEQPSQEATSVKIWSRGTLVYTKVALVILFCWLLWGDFAWAMKDRAVGPAATLLFRSFGFSDFMYSAICIAFPNLTNIFLCPVISYISDRHRGRLGRRIPFLIFTTPFIVAGLIGLGFTPMLGTWLANLAQIDTQIGKLIVFGIFWVILDFGTTLAGALSGALINDVVPSELLGRFFGLFRAFSLLAGMIFNFFLMGKVEEYSLYIFVGVGLIYGIGLASLCWKVKEGEYPPVKEVIAAPGAARIYGPVLTYFRQCFSHEYYRWVIVMLVLAMMAAAPFNMFSIFYAKSINMDMDLYGKLTAYTYAISFGLSYFLGWLADRFHPLRATIVSQFFYLGSMIFGWFFVKENSTMFAIAMMAHVVLSGCYFTVSASLALRLFPRILFAQFNSAFAMILAATNVLCGLLFGWLLGLLSRNYSYTFLFGLIMTVASIFSLLYVYRRFLGYGGDESYCPPDPGN